MQSLGIFKVCAGRRSSADPRDPYFIPALMGKFDFIEDPYSGMWKNIIRIMFSSPDGVDLSGPCVPVARTFQRAASGQPSPRACNRGM